MRASSAAALVEDPAVEPAVAVTAEAARFAALWQRRVATPPSPAGAAVFAGLCALYDEPHRRFHNLHHIRDCLQRFDQVAPLLVDRDAVELALWFHDAVYDVGASTNERRSAEMFIELSPGARFTFRHHVCGLIMATRHAREVHGNDRSFMVDIDLSGFGLPWDDFIANGARLREEAAQVTEEQYHRGQVMFLSRLQRRDRFFHTDWFRERFEAQARANLARILDELGRQGYVAATA